MGWLRGRPSGTAEQAAAHLDVTPRTILRDIASLRGRGEAISSSSGPGGGFHLDAMARHPTVRMSTEEILGLAIAVSMASQFVTKLPYSTAANHVVARLITTLPRDRAARFRHLMQRVTIGLPPSLLHPNAESNHIDGDLLDIFEVAFSQDRVVTFDYTDAQGQETSRAVEPHGLLLHLPTWYVVAHDRLRDAARMFRVDRMRSVALLDEVFEPKPPAWFEEYLGSCATSAQDR